MLLALLFFLFAGHALMDYALQPDVMAGCKCRNHNGPAAKAVPWYYWLTAHAVLHGAMVGVVVRWFGFGWESVALLAFAEAIVHWFIDFGKCEKWFGIHIDQALHITCKLVWLALIATEVVLP